MLYFSIVSTIGPLLVTYIICFVSAIVPLKCKKCERYYIGQTGRKFKTRYKEHIRDIKTTKVNTGDAEHILNTGHSYGTIYIYKSECVCLCVCVSDCLSVQD
jgi:hypothetical protein